MPNEINAFCAMYSVLSQTHGCNFISHLFCFYFCGRQKDDDDWVKKCMEYDQGEDQRGPGKRLFERTVKHVS